MITIEMVFVCFKDLRPGKLPCPLHRDELNLGDIFLGVEFVMKQCQEESQDLHGALTVSTQSWLIVPHVANLRFSMGILGHHYYILQCNTTF